MKNTSHLTAWAAPCLALALLASPLHAAQAAEAAEKTVASHAASMLAGKWVYRSIKNIPDPNVDIGDMKLLVAVIDIPPFSGNRFSGTMTATEHGKDVRHVLEGEVQGDRFTMRAVQGNQNTEGWVYDYTGWVVPKWKDGQAQTPTFVGSVLRVTAHPYPGGGTSHAGASYTIIGMKQPDQVRSSGQAAN